LGDRTGRGGETSIISEHLTAAVDFATRLSIDNFWFVLPTFFHDDSNVDSVFSSRSDKCTPRRWIIATLHHYIRLRPEGKGAR